MAWDWIRANATALSLVVVVISGIISGIVGTVWYFGQLVGRLTAVTTVDAVERKVDALSEQVSTLVTTTTVDEVERKVDALTGAGPVGTAASRRRRERRSGQVAAGPRGGRGRFRRFRGPIIVPLVVRPAPAGRWSRLARPRRT